MSTPDAETRVLDLLLNWEELRARGQNPRVEELCTDCPELAEELAGHIRVLLALTPPRELGEPGASADPARVPR